MTKHTPKSTEGLPLYQRLLLKEEQAKQEASNHIDSEVKSKRNKRNSSELRPGNKEEDFKEENFTTKKKKKKASPAELRSDRPVRRLRVDADNTNRQNSFRDPRFGDDVSGKLDQRKFIKNYDFLDEYRQDEIQKMTKVLKKVKNSEKKNELRSELLKMKQQHSERTRGINVIRKMDQLQADERGNTYYRCLICITSNLPTTCSQIYYIRKIG